jgi:hypothetical protein
MPAADPSVIKIAGAGQLTDPGVGNFSIQFMQGTGALVLHSNSVDHVSGFDPTMDVLDLHALLAEANVSLNGDIAVLSKYLTVVDQGSDALVGFDATGHGGGSTIAVLQGLGSSVAGLDALFAHGAIRLT